MVMEQRIGTRWGEPSFGMIGQIGTAPAKVVATGWHAAWLSTDEFDPCSAWAEPVSRIRKKERVRT